jgi:hypothetical protein
MTASFAFDVDPARHLVRTTLRGFFTPAVLDAYLTARRAAFAQLRCPVTHHLALTDVREMKIQSQEMVAAFGTLLADPATRSRRLAFVTASTLARQQLRRAIGHRDARCFTDMDEAQAWLLSGEPATRVA